MRRTRQRGVTLIEVLIAVTLLALLSAGMLTAMRVGLSAMSKTDAKLMDNRRMTGAQRIIEQEIAGFMPEPSVCKVEAPVPGAPIRIGFFQGEPQEMRFASTFSLAGGWRGQPQILEFTVIPGEEGRGFRLIVNETPYAPTTAERHCIGQMMDPLENVMVPRFRRIEPGPTSFVLADKLAGCRFFYLQGPVAPTDRKHKWRSRWVAAGMFPLAIRVEMAPLEVTPGRLQPVSVTVPIRVNKSLEIQYVDQQ
jgi:prepilin-type N-terminal cleavage/methylation domain-containing protein